MFLVYKFLILAVSFAVCSAKVGPKIKCTPETMRVEVPILATTKRAYVAGLRDYPEPACRPHTDPSGTLVVFEFDLRDVYQCAVTRALNKQTGKQIYYQTLVIENEEKLDGSRLLQETRETIHVKCSILSLKNHTIAKRSSVLPAGFEEPESINITDTYEKRAPEPVLGVGVRQAGKLVTGELNVSPGTPLQMEIFLDNASAPIYGILVTHMQVTDTKTQEETIIYNGCSVDPYLFENFNTVDGDFLTAKFRAFKFPESTYVQFKGTVHVCLNKCQGVECSDGQIGYGRRRRRRRSISTLPADPNKIFEITITSFIKVNYDDESENFEEIIRNQTSIFKNHKLKTANQMQDDKRFYKTIDSRDGTREEIVREEQKLTTISAVPNSAQKTPNLPFFVILLAPLVKIFM